MIPLIDFGSGDTYHGYPGGLYPDGNDPPEPHAIAGVDIAASLASGPPFVLLSAGMSNVAVEFARFANKAVRDADFNAAQVTLVNGGQQGATAEEWIDPDLPIYDAIQDRLTAAGLFESDVRVVWMKMANDWPILSLPDVDADAFDLQLALSDITVAMQARYPNLAMIFISSRIYAGNATSDLNPEPFAYESGFAVKWLVESALLLLDAPWIGWGPYLWADGSTARSDGLVWLPEDFAEDGTHPSNRSGVNKVATMLLDFFKGSQFTVPWFVSEGGNVPPGRGE